MKIKGWKSLSWSAGNSGFYVRDGSSFPGLDVLIWTMKEKAPGVLSATGATALSYGETITLEPISEKDKYLYERETWSSSY